jgi:DNA polymerase I-like protein with 3'-5' exonuclease and polymerase domains
MPVIAAHEIDVRDGSMAIYNGLDCALTFEVDEVRQDLRRNDTLIYDFERAMQGCALEMMLRGFRVDVDERERAIISTQKRRADTERVIERIVRAVQGSYNPKLPNSPTQLQHLFYDVMRLKPIERWSDGEVKRPMNRETLERLSERDKFAELIINAVLFHRDISKALQVLETQIDSDWRWRCSYNIGGTKTGRWSSSKSPFMVFNDDSGWKQTGNNFQNISEEWRRVFIPDPGFKLYGIDKSQSEARDVGWFCGVVFGDWSYLDACESGDLHTYVTRLCYPEWNWTGDLKKDRALADRRFYRFFTYRDVSKRVGHATNYMGQPTEISKQTRLPLDITKEFQERYFDAFPCIRRMHSWVTQQLQRERFLVNSFGRRRDFFDRPDAHDTIKGAVAYMFQSATGDCLNLGLYRLWKKMGTRIQILSQLHDAVYFQARIPANDDEEQKMLREALDLVQVTQHDPKSGRSMTIPGEVVGGFNWAHRFKLHEDGTLDEWNPQGLDKIRVA